jgi:hypothetical protein
MWDTRVDEAVDYFSISCKFRSIIDLQEWSVSGVYGPQNDWERLLMWEELADIRSWWGVPWCLDGDFNVTRFPSGKLGGQHFTQAMVGFSDFVFTCGLLTVDTPLEGGRQQVYIYIYTWSNSRYIYIKEVY